MVQFDGLPRDFRDLANEYGVKLVVAMRADGYTRAAALEPELIAYRERKQDEFFAISNISDRLKAGFMRASTQRDRKVEREIFATTGE